MTTLANDISIRFLGPKFDEGFLVQPSTAQTFYKGVPVMLDVSVSTTGVVTADGVSVTTNDVFVGIAEEKLAVVATDGPKYISTIVWPSIVGFPSAVFTIADLGKPVYAGTYTATGITLTASAGTACRLGKLFTVKDGYAFIIVDAPYVH